MEAQNNTVEKNIADILEIVVAIKDGMATKDELNNVRNDIHALDNKMTIELRSIQTELDDIKMQLDKWGKRTRQDSDASVVDILDLRRRVQELEQQVKRLQAA